ncbi:MAG: peptide deformylase [Candidatus Eisenbacteria bacterium]|nr:peptide deformylase [Candidatus Eisenbacteria bacterium]
MPSEELALRFYGDPVLRRKASDVDTFDASLAKRAETMFEIMYEHDGIGLAGNQVGLLSRLIVLDVSLDDDHRVRMALCNPRILARKGEDVAEEGCLSIPDVRSDVSRADILTVEAEGLDGKTIRFEAEGLLARAIQHEIDHLDGVLFIDRLSATRRKLLEGRLREIAREHSI